MTEQDIQSEAEALNQRFTGINRKKFAEENQFPGGPAMVYQNITARKPISRKGALVYAKFFCCSLKEISPYWSTILEDQAPENQQSVSAYKDVVRLDTKRRDLRPLRAQLMEIADSISDVGLAILIGRAQEIALQHPLSAPAKREN